MNRRAFLSAVAATLVAPALPMPELIKTVSGNGYARGGIDTREPARWKNYSASYSPPDREFLAKFRAAFRDTKFTAPQRPYGWIITNG